MKQTITDLFRLGPSKYKNGYSHKVGLIFVWVCFKFDISLSFIVCGALVDQWVRSLDLTTHTSLSPIRRGFAPGFVNYKKVCTRLAAASDKVYQLLAHGRWFSLGHPASSTTKTGSHDIAEILLKMALNTKNQINQPSEVWTPWLGHKKYLSSIHYGFRD